MLVRSVLSFLDAVGDQVEPQKHGLDVYQVRREHPLGEECGASRQGTRTGHRGANEPLLFLRIDGTNAHTLGKTGVGRDSHSPGI